MKTNPCTGIPHKIQYPYQKCIVWQFSQTHGIYEHMNWEGGKCNGKACNILAWLSETQSHKGMAIGNALKARPYISSNSLQYLCFAKRKHQELLFS